MAYILMKVQFWNTTHQVWYAGPQAVCESSSGGSISSLSLCDGPTLNHEATDDEDRHADPCQARLTCILDAPLYVVESITSTLAYW